MKKLLTLILLTASLISINLFDIFALTLEYEFTITDNKRWNLQTGVIEDDLRYTITNRIQIIPSDDQTIDAFADTYHHVLFYNDRNQYIGYKNTPYSTYQIEGRYLGNIQDDPNYPGFTYPENAKFFTFMLYKSGNRIPQEALNDLTLLQVFGDYVTNNYLNKDNPELDDFTLNEFATTEMVGKNIANKYTSILKTYIDLTNGNLILETNIGWETTQPINVIENEIYTASGYFVTSTGLRIAFYDNLDNYISGLSLGSNVTETFTTPANTSYLRLAYRNTNTQPVGNLQLVKGQFATPYEPYYEYLTNDTFSDFVTIPNVNYFEINPDNYTRIRYVVNQDIVTNNDQPLLELNGLSLNEVFDINNEFIFNYQGSNVIDFDNNTYLIDNFNQFSYNPISINVNNVYYINYSIKKTTTTGNLITRFNDDNQVWGNSNDIINFQNYKLKYTSTSNSVWFPYLSDSTAPDYYLLKEPILLNLTLLGLEHLSQEQLDQYYEIYKYFNNGGTAPQTFIYDEPIYYDITYRLIEYFSQDMFYGIIPPSISTINLLNFWINAYYRIINNQNINDLDAFYAGAYADANNPTLTQIDIIEWIDYYLQYLTFINANDVYIEPLNYLTLNEIFEDNNLANGVWQQTFLSSYTLVNGLYTINVNGSNPSLFKTNSLTLNNKYWASAEMMTTNQVDYLEFFVGQTYRENNPNLNQWYKFNIYNVYTTFVSGDLRLRALPNINGGLYYAKNVHIVDLTALDIDTQTKLQMDNYFRIYQENNAIQENNYLLSFFPTSLNNIQPQSTYTEPIGDTFLDTNAEGFLDNLLTNVGFNNGLGRTTLALVILLFTGIALVSIKASTTIIISVEILTFVGLTFLGWLPAWINIMIALGLILLVFLKFNNGGSTNETSD